MCLVYGKPNTALKGFSAVLNTFGLGMVCVQVSGLGLLQDTIVINQKCSSFKHNCCEGILLSHQPLKRFGEEVFSKDKQSPQCLYSY